jgi:sodium-dependent dicarboxylate transporter 2/3/5
MKQLHTPKYWLALGSGPIIFLLLLILLKPIMNFKAAAALGTIVWMGLWWITTPVHITVTAFLPVVVNCFLNLVPMGPLVSQYFSEIIVLLFGADLICLTWSVTGLDKRLSLKTLCLIGPSIKQQILVWLVASTVLSVFLPNAVVCTIFIPVAVAMLKFAGEKDISTSKVAVPIILAITWGAGIGGFGSPLGGAANLVGIAYVEKLIGKEFMYVEWVIRFVPILIVIMLVNLLYLYSMKLPVDHIEGTKEYFKETYEKLGPMGRGELISFLLFVIATIMAFIRPLYAQALPGLKPAYVFLTLGLLAFFITDEKDELLITWPKATKEVMWGMFFLFGGGLALGQMVTETGAAAALANLIARGNLTGGLGTVALFVVFTCGLAEISSNTGAAAIASPVVISIAQALGLNPLPYLFVAIIAFNNAYILPVSIRAIPVGYGLSPAVMMKHGFRLAICTMTVITFLSYFLINHWSLFNKI